MIPFFIDLFSSPGDCLLVTFPSSARFVGSWEVLRSPSGASSPRFSLTPKKIVRKLRNSQKWLADTPSGFTTNHVAYCFRHVYQRTLLKISFCINFIDFWSTFQYYWFFYSWLARTHARTHGARTLVFFLLWLMFARIWFIFSLIFKSILLISNRL